MKSNRKTSSRTAQFLRAVLFLSLMALLTSQAFGQQYVTRYDAFIGYAYLNSPKISLAEPGFDFQFGMRPSTWYSIGFDYSRATGSMTLTPGLLPTALQQQLGGLLGQLAAAGKLPPGYKLAVNANSNTQSFEAGPQLAYRHWTHMTIFVRPALGAIREDATPNPSDPIATLVVRQLTPAGHKTDWAAFYGFGGGVDYIPTRHFAFRFQADFVRDHLFNDILREARNTVRFSIGPAFNFGKRVE